MKKIFVLLLATAMIFALAACGATPNGTAVSYTHLTLPTIA